MKINCGGNDDDGDSNYDAGADYFVVDCRGLKIIQRALRLLV